MDPVLLHNIPNATLKRDVIVNIPLLILVQILQLRHSHDS